MGIKTPYCDTLSTISCICSSGYSRKGCFSKGIRLSTGSSVSVPFSELPSVGSNRSSIDLNVTPDALEGFVMRDHLLS